jgi:putative DNA-invertase from lambdoid prophage Rac
VAVYAYTRVSTARQAEEGESIAVQERTVAGYAQMHGLTIDRVFSEHGISGSKPLAERPEGAGLLAVLQPGDTVITAKLDRMFRSALDALEVLGRMRDKGISLHMIDLGGDVTGNGIAKLVFTILSAVAEAERDRISERIATVKADQRTRGRHLGGSVPFGYRVEYDYDADGVRRGGRLIEIPDQQAAIADMCTMRQAGHSLRAIAAAMQARGHKISHVAVEQAIDRKKGLLPRHERRGPPDMTKQPKQPTADDGVIWWNNLTDRQRRAALKAANTTVPAEAFAHHLRLERWAAVAANALRPRKPSY